MGHPVFDLARPFVLAHRGGADEALENAASAFERAAGLGVAAIETDLRVTSDGVCVISHDATLDRTTDRTGRISQLPWAYVRRAKIGGQEPIMRLEDLFDAVPELALNLDLKDDGVVPAFVRAVRGSRELERICVGSFADHRLTRVRDEIGPALATSMGPRQVARLRFTGVSLERSVVAVQVPAGIGPIHLVTAGFVAAAERAGLQVHVWTVDDAGDVRRLLGLGVAGIITDRPTMALAEIARFGTRG